MREQLREKKYLASGRGEMINGKLAVGWQWVCNPIQCIGSTVQQERERVSDRYQTEKKNGIMGFQFNLQGTTLAILKWETLPPILKKRLFFKRKKRKKKKRDFFFFFFILMTNFYIKIYIKKKKKKKRGAMLTTFLQQIISGQLLLVKI